MLIEIKSSEQVRPEQLTTLSKLTDDLGNAEGVFFSQDPYKKQYEKVTVYTWQEGVKKYFIPQDCSEDVLGSNN